MITFYSKSINVYVLFKSTLTFTCVKVTFFEKGAGAINRLKELKFPSTNASKVPLTLIDSICPNSSKRLVRSCWVAFLSTWPTQRVVLQTLRKKHEVTNGVLFYNFHKHSIIFG